jgi:endonuclease-3
VNLITPVLFKRYPDAASLADSSTPELEGIIRSAGFFRSKAKSLQEMAKAVVSKFGGKVPRTMEELLTLRGVARKTANVVLGTAYGQAEGVVVDTHIKRLSFRLGLTDETDPEKVERELMALLPRKEWVFFGHALIWHGRRICKAPAPDCENCLMKTFCPRRGVV